MKIAVCLFGHVGGKTGSDGDGGWLDVSSSLLNFIELHKAYDIDYFIHSWSVLEEEKICELLKPSAKLFEPQIQFKYPLDYIDLYLFVRFYINIYSYVYKKNLFCINITILEL